MPAPTRTDTALLLAKVDYRDSDCVVTLFTEQLGKVSALARGARRSTKRFGGTLEPMHTLSVHLDTRTSGDLMILREASLSVPRTKLVARLEALETAGRALAWVRASTPQHHPEARVYHNITALLDTLNAEPPDRELRSFLAEFGLSLLSELGFGIDFENCVRCGRECAPGRAAYVDARKGGLVCRACGGASTRLEGPMRERLTRASEGVSPVLEPEDVDPALRLVEKALEEHMGVERR